MSHNRAVWVILKAEIVYSRTALMVVFAIILGFFTIGLLLGTGLYGFMSNTAVTYLIAVAAMGSESDKERRDRLYMLLPSPVAVVSILRVLFVILFQLIILGLWGLYGLMTGGSLDSGTLPLLVSANAAVLILIGLFVIYHDLGFFQTHEYRIAFFIVLSVILLGIVSSLFTSGAAQLARYRNFIAGWLGASTLSIFGIGMYSFSLSLFTRRKSFLQ